MPENESKTPRKISLEELLRLKRHERPGTEFWARFDREYRERAMRALIELAPSAGAWVGGLLALRRTWLGIGSVAAVVLALAWQGHLSSPINRSLATVMVASNTSITPAQSATQPQAVADNSTLATNKQNAASADNTDSANTAFVVAAMPEATNTANNQKVPATVAFAEHADGVRYAADTFVGTAWASRLRGSAY